MALELALPLFGLEPAQFSALSAKLLRLQELRDLPDFGRSSPSVKSDSSGVSSLAESIESTPELTPISSRPETPIDEPSKSQEEREERINITTVDVNANNIKCDVRREELKTSVPCRVMYGGRDVLNLGANIRESCWQIRDPFPQLRYGDNNFTINRSIYQSSITDHENKITVNYATKHCGDCGFYTPIPNTF